jgi:hypothetical protein
MFGILGAFARVALELFGVVAGATLGKTLLRIARNDPQP